MRCSARPPAREALRPHLRQRGEPRRVGLSPGADANRDAGTQQRDGGARTPPAASPRHAARVLTLRAPTAAPVSVGGESSGPACAHGARRVRAAPAGHRLDLRVGRDSGGPRPYRRGTRARQSRRHHRSGRLGRESRERCRPADRGTHTRMMGIMAHPIAERIVRRIADEAARHRPLRVAGQKGDTLMSTATSATTVASSGPREDSTRRVALITGILFVVTFVTSIPALLLYDPVLNQADYIIGAGVDARVRWGAFLEVVLAVANVGTAIVLFPVLKRQHEGVALGYVATRVVESVIIMVGIVSVLSVV